MKGFRVGFEILKEIAVLNENNNGWKKELNLVSWNGKPPKYDVRWWSPNKESIGKGVTLTPEEFFLLGETSHGLPKDYHEVQ